MKSVILGVVLALTGTTVSFSGAIAEEASITASKPRLIARTMSDEGYKAKLETLESDNSPVIRSKSSGTNWSLYFYGCDKDGEGCTTIQFHVSYNMTDGMSAESVNSWNRNKRFGKVYLDDEQDPAMEWDVNLDFGVTPKNLLDSVDWWVLTMGNFEEYIEW
jgi:Putative bacterial sensory transduction regulator